MNGDETRQLAALAQLVTDFKEELRNDVLQLQEKNDKIQAGVSDIQSRVAVLEATHDRCPMLNGQQMVPADVEVGKTTGMVRAMGLPNTWTARTVIAGLGGISGSTLIVFALVFYLLWKAGVIHFTGG